MLERQELEERICYLNNGNDTLFPVKDNYEDISFLIAHVNIHMYDTPPNQKTTRYQGGS